MYEQYAQSIHVSRMVVWVEFTTYELYDTLTGMSQTSAWGFGSRPSNYDYIMPSNDT